MSSTSSKAAGDAKPWLVVPLVGTSLQSRRPLAHSCCTLNHSGPGCLAGVGSRRSCHHAAARVESDVSAQPERGRHRHVQAGFGKKAERGSETSGERGGAGEGECEVLLKFWERHRLGVTDADLGVFRTHLAAGGVGDTVGEQRGLPRTGFTIGKPGSFHGDFIA